MPPKIPYSRPFQRATFAELFGQFPYVHLRRRHAHAAYFAARNPEGWWHDLGAQDVFLDNFGVVVREQLDGTTWESGYRYAMQFAMQRWELARYVVLPDRPWWGSNINSRRRRAATGEPRSLLRLIPEDLAQLAAHELALLLEHSPHKADGLLLDKSGNARLFERNEYVDLGRLFRNDPVLFEGMGSNQIRLDDWSNSVWPTLFERGDDSTGFGSDWIAPPDELAFGALLPPELQQPLDELRILHPRHSTPDLPPRVGVNTTDLETYVEVLDRRGQGKAPSCVAHAVCFALEVAASRIDELASGRRLSPAWLHLRTGDIGEGRHLRDTVRVVQEQLPCEESELPHERLIEGTLTHDALRLSSVIESSRQLTSGIGLPVVRQLDVHDVSTIKACLAAGWVVVLTTRFLDGVRDQLRDPFIWNHGLLLSPLPGDSGDKAHAWCLVGYDHVDGATNWKYQGRFIALNSWGPFFAAHSPHGPGTLTIPFSFLLTEGIEAFAIRFPSIQ